MPIQPLLQTSFERRIPLRLIAYWEKLRNGRPMPAERDIIPDDIRDLWDNCFLVHVKDIMPSHYRYSYLGRDIIKAYNGSLLNNNSDAVISPQEGMIDGYATVLRTRKPLIESGEFSNMSNEIVKYRQCLLPLGEGEEVQAIFGALHLRIFPV